MSLLTPKPVVNNLIYSHREPPPLPLPLVFHEMNFHFAAFGSNSDELSSSPRIVVTVIADTVAKITRRNYRDEKLRSVAFPFSLARLFSLQLRTFGRAFQMSRANYRLDQPAPISWLPIHPTRQPHALRGCSTRCYTPHCRRADRQLNGIKSVVDR